MSKSSSQVLLSETVSRKKSGPHNKHSKKKRLDDVRRMYFEEGYSVVDVAKNLGVHRNTVSSDVRYWLGQSEKQGIGDEITEFFYKEKALIESQKIRILKKIKAETDFNKSYKLERLLISLYDKEMKFYLKFQGNVRKYPIVGDKLVKKLIRELAFDEFSFRNKKEIVSEIINKTKCDAVTANSIVNEMERLGLYYAKVDFNPETSMAYFANLCGFISDGEFSEILKKIDHREEKEEHEYNERLAKYTEDFIAEHGDPKSWISDIQREFELGKLVC